MRVLLYSAHSSHCVLTAITHFLGDSGLPYTLRVVMTVSQVLCPASIPAETTFAIEPDNLVKHFELFSMASAIRIPCQSCPFVSVVSRYSVFLRRCTVSNGISVFIK